jgi:hypothetical protein
VKAEDKVKSSARVVSQSQRAEDSRQDEPVSLCCNYILFPNGKHCHLKPRFDSSSILDAEVFQGRYPSTESSVKMCRASSYSQFPVGTTYATNFYTLAKGVSFLSTARQQI